MSLTPHPGHTSCLVTAGPWHVLPSSLPLGPVQPSALISILHPLHMHPLHTQPPVGPMVKPRVRSSHMQAVPPPSPQGAALRGGSRGGGSLLPGEPRCAQADASSGGPWHLWASSASRNGAQVPTLHPLTWVWACVPLGGEGVAWVTLLCALHQCGPPTLTPSSPEPASVPGTRSRSLLQLRGWLWVRSRSECVPRRRLWLLI